MKTVMLRSIFACASAASPGGPRSVAARQAAHLLGGASAPRAVRFLRASRTRPFQGGRGGHRGRTARRLFDSGSFFGVGIPEALVVALLGWFLLGPEELYRLAKQVGGWLGELRNFVGQAAQQYESALDDESTRKAIAGIRETQRTISEVSSSWRSVADSLRDPLAIGSTLESTYSKYAEKDAAAASDKDKDKGKDKGKAGAASSGYPDLDADDADEKEQKLEELKAKSKESAESLWYSGRKAADNEDKPKDVEGYLSRLDGRLEEVEGMATKLLELREDILVDREAIRRALKEREGNESSSSANNAVEKTSSEPKVEKEREGDENSNGANGAVEKKPSEPKVEKVSDAAGGKEREGDDSSSNSANGTAEKTPSEKTAKKGPEETVAAAEAKAKETVAAGTAAPQNVGS